MDTSRCFTPLCRRQPVCVPAIEVPIVNWPVPAYMMLHGPLCRECAMAFSLAKFTDYEGSWYDRIADELRAVRKPAVNPYPDDPSFRWDYHIINPNFEPVPRDQCKLQFWTLESVFAKGASAPLWR